MASRGISHKKTHNTIKCKYCEYTCYRFKGSKYMGDKMFQHVINDCAESFLKDLGYNGSIVDYLNSRENDYT